MEATGLTVGLAGLIISGVNVPRTIAQRLKWALEEYQEVYQKDGAIALILLAILPDAYATLNRLGTALSNERTDFMLIRTLLVSNLNMIAVAGAIISQIGISALSLEAVGQVHWTASAFFVTSLVLGVLSVYSSFIVQQELNGLLSVDEVADWFSRPMTPNQGRQASALAAIRVASPVGFLGLSLNAFLIGLGIYLGCVYTSNLIPQYGKGGSLGILIFFLVAATSGTFVYSFPGLLKASETKTTHRLRQAIQDLEHI